MHNRKAKPLIPGYVRCETLTLIPILGEQSEGIGAHNQRVSSTTGLQIGSQSLLVLL
jgi:hypothetical protein